MQRHQHDLVLDLAVGEVVGVGDERHLLEELVDAGELAGRADQLVEVLDAPRRLDGVLGLAARRGSPSPRGRPAAGRPGPAGASPAVRSTSESISTTNDSMPRSAGPVTPASSAWRRASKKPRPVPAAYCVELGDAGVADPALGHVEHPLHAHLVGRVDHRPQVRHRVADLAAVVVAGAADHLVRHAEAHERLLDDAALGVGAVQHGHLAPVRGVACCAGRGPWRRRSGPRRPRPRRGSARCGHRRRRRSTGSSGVPLGVVGDDRVGGVEDRLRAAVVLVEHDRGDPASRRRTPPRTG